MECLYEVNGMCRLIEEGGSDLLCDKENRAYFEKK